MPLQRPRRIFIGGRPEPSRFGLALRGGVLAGIAFAGCAAVVLLTARPSELLGSAPAAPDSVVAEPRQVAVVDGDTLRLKDFVVRLHGVAAPARGRACADGQGAAYDCGAAASSALGSLVRDRRVACRLNGHDGAGLAQGVCEAEGIELSHALVAAGWARAESAGLEAAEASARAGRLGLWRNGANPRF